MRAIGKHRSGFGKVAAAEIFQNDREVVRQFAGRKLKARLRIQLLEIDHRLAAVAAFAVKMLKEVQRQCPSSVEQVDIAFFDCQKIVMAKLVDQIEEVA